MSTELSSQPQTPSPPLPIVNADNLHGDSRVRPRLPKRDSKADQGLLPSPCVEHEKFDGSEEEAASEVVPKERSADIDGWDEEPANPRNWSTARKWRNTGIISFYTMITPLASSMMAPGLPAIAKHYRITSPTLVALTLSAYILAWAVGPLLVGPLSEIYGRLRILHTSNLLFGIFSLAQIFAPNTATLTVFRFLAGIGGCAPVAIGGSCISDLFSDKERGNAMSAYTIGPLLGPVIGPIAGGFMVQAIGFKYIFVLLTALAGVAGAIGIVFLEETYHPVIKNALAKHRARDVDVEVRGDTPKLEILVTPDFLDVLRVNLSRPFLLLTRSLICFSLSLFMALTYGFLYLMFTTFPTLFSDLYGWGPGVSGLAYLGPGVGFLAATAVGAPLMNKTYLTLCERNGGKGRPEFRIPTMFLGSFMIPIGLLWYGWSAQTHIHWIMPIVGAGIFSSGMMFTFLPIQLYLVDAFTYAASALAAASVLRALFGFAFPLFGQQMFAAIGLGGGNSLLAGLAIITGIPFPLWIYHRGEQLRARNPLNR